VHPPGRARSDIFISDRGGCGVQFKEFSGYFIYTAYKSSGFKVRLKCTPAAKILATPVL